MSRAFWRLLWFPVIYCLIRGVFSVCNAEDFHYKKYESLGPQEIVPASGWKKKAIPLTTIEWVYKILSLRSNQAPSDAWETSSWWGCPRCCQSCCSSSCCCRHCWKISKNRRCWGCRCRSRRCWSCRCRSRRCSCCWWNRSCCGWWNRRYCGWWNRRYCGWWNRRYCGWWNGCNRRNRRIRRNSFTITIRIFFGQKWHQLRDMGFWVSCSICFKT